MRIKGVVNRHTVVKADSVVLESWSFYLLPLFFSAGLLFENAFMDVFPDHLECI